jgi:short-subunit dehydrogenase
VENDSKVSLITRPCNPQVVTGATDGIGREYAKELARKGMDIVLISRTESKLMAVAEEIRESCRRFTAH